MEEVVATDRIYVTLTCDSYATWILMAKEPNYSCIAGFWATAACIISLFYSGGETCISNRQRRMRRLERRGSPLVRAHSENADLDSSKSSGPATSKTSSKPAIAG